MRICEENTVAVSLETFDFWAHSVLGHHTVSSSSTSETRCRRYKQSLYLRNADVPSSDLNTGNPTRARISLTTHTELQKTPIPPPQAPSRAQAGPRLWHLGFPSGPRQQDTQELWAKLSPPISPVSTLSCWGSTLEEWTKQKISARNDLLSL